MSFARTKRLLIALLAQVTLCLSLAPVLAAQVPTQKKDSKGTESPAGDGLTILAARDAANGRPEDVSETEQSQVRRVGRVSTRRFGREETRRVETRSTAGCESNALSPSSGTPGEGWGGEFAEVRTNKCCAINAIASPQHSALNIVGCASAHVQGRSNPAIPRVLKHTLHEAPTPTLPRSTGRGNIASSILLTCAEAHPTLRSLFLGDCVQPTGPPAK
jgi:hypothetical protein